MDNEKQDVDFISGEKIKKLDEWRRKNLTEEQYKRLKLREDYDLPKRRK